jgi:hypothetical protein
MCVIFSFGGFCEYAYQNLDFTSNLIHIKIMVQYSTKVFSEMRPHLRAVIKFLRQAGAHNVRIEYGSKHPRCYYSWLNKETFYVLPNSPGDAYHGQRNAISDLRRKLGLQRRSRDHT